MQNDLLAGIILIAGGLYLPFLGVHPVLYTGRTVLVIYGAALLIKEFSS